MKRTSALATILLAVVLSACSRPPNNTEMTEETTGRFTVRRVGVFRDTLAYDNQRGIYLIRDNKTEREYVGVSGVGISELGTHEETTQTGKTTTTTNVPDER